MSANAGFNEIPQALVVGDLDIRGEPTPEKLQSFLWQSHEQFPDCQIWLTLSRELKPLMEALATSGAIRWERVQFPLSVQARVLQVHAPHSAF
jgi:hypothetical protein